MALPPPHDSGVSPCLHGYLVFLHRHFPPQSPLSCPFGPSLCIQQQTSPRVVIPPPDTTQIPPQSLHSSSLPATVPSRGLASLSGLRMARIICVIPTAFRLSQVNCFTLGLKCFSSVPNNCPSVGAGPRVQFPHLAKAGPVLLTLLFSSQLPSSYQVLHGSMYSFLGIRFFCPFSAGAASSFVSEGVFLMYPWMYSTST